MGFILVDKDDYIIARGITDDFVPGSDETVHEIADINDFPDEMLFCKFVNDKIIVDEDFKTAYESDKEAKKLAIDAVKNSLKTKYKGKTIDDISDGDALDYVRTLMVQDKEVV